MSKPHLVEPAIAPPLPQNLDAERSVLGAILLDDHALGAAIEILKSGDFALDHHRRIFNQMIELGEAQRAIDLVTLSDQLHCKGELEAAGGAAYIAQLVDGVPRISHLEHYARIVKQKSVLRSLIYATRAIQQSAFEAEEDSDAILRDAEQRIAGLKSECAATKISTYTPAELAALVSEGVEYIAYPFACRGLIALLDGAAKSAGKTTMVLTAVGASSRRELFLNHATKRVPVLYVTEENSRTFRLSLDRAGLRDESDVHILPYSSIAGMPWAQIAGHIERLCAELKIGWVVIDTFYSIAGLGGEKENHAGAVDEAVAPLRAIAAKFDVPITLTRHERKSGGEVGLSGRGSVALTGAADVIVLLKRIQGSSESNRRQIEITGRVDQASHAIELSNCRYTIIEPGDDARDENTILVEAIQADPTASARRLETLTGIGRNRIPKLAEKLGWSYSEDSRWERTGA